MRWCAFCTALAALQLIESGHQVPIQAELLGLSLPAVLLEAVLLLDGEARQLPDPEWLEWWHSIANKNCALIPTLSTNIAAFA